MNVVRVGVSPWKHMNPECLLSKNADCKAGVELEILHTIASISNVPLSIVVTNGAGCGKLSTESNDSLLDMLERGEIDMIGNFCDGRKLSYAEEKVFSFSYPIWQYHEQFVIQAPSPSPMSFRPFAPFTIGVWIGCLVTFIFYLAFVAFYYYTRSGSDEKMIVHINRAGRELRDICMGYLKRLPARIIWPLWIVFLTFLFMFYNTFILSSVLQPFPIFQPFSDTNGLVEALRAAYYRYVSHKDPPAVPSGCLGQECEKIFNNAMKKRGFKYVPRASGGKLLSTIADQNPKETPKYVLAQGAPFISLYLSEFQGDHSQFWLLDGTHVEKWSCYVWRKDFPYANKFNTNLLHIGDYKFVALTRYLQHFGTQPRTGERIVETARKQAISIFRIQSLFYVYFGGVLAAGAVLWIELVYARNQCKHNFDVSAYSGCSDPC